MSQDGGYFKLGLFVVVATGLLAAALVILGAGSMWENVRMVETAVTESVQGLDPGAPVKFRGVRIGQVKSIDMSLKIYKAKDIQQQLQLARYITIRMEIMPVQIENVIPLEKLTESGLRVRMAQAGITGPAYLEVLLLDPVKYPPPQLPFTPEYAFVPSTPGFVQTIMTGVEALADEMRKMKLSETVDNANKLMLDLQSTVRDLRMAEMSGRVIAILDDAKKSTGRIYQILDSPEVDRMIKDSSTAASELPAITLNLRHSTERIDQIVHDPAVQKAINGLGDAGANAGAVTVELRRTLREISTLIAAQSRDLEILIANLRRASDNAAALSEDARENPSRLLFGQPPTRTSSGEK
jgi:paraquat-inducible protein B